MCLTQYMMRISDKEIVNLYLTENEMQDVKSEYSKTKDE